MQQYTYSEIGNKIKFEFFSNTSHHLGQLLYFHCRYKGSILCGKLCFIQWHKVYTFRCIQMRVIFIPISFNIKNKNLLWENNLGEIIEKYNGLIIVFSSFTYSIALPWNKLWRSRGFTKIYKPQLISLYWKCHEE